MLHRVRVSMGVDQKGAPLYKWVSGKNQDALNDAIVAAYVQSGRIWDFIKTPLPEFEPEMKNLTETTFREYTEHWLTTYKKLTIKPTTMRGYRTMLESHLYPAFQDKIFDSITTDDVQEFLNKRADLSRKYLTDMVHFLGSISKDAMEDKVIRQDPTHSRKLSIPSQKKTTREALKKEDFLDIAAHLKELTEGEALLVAFMLFTGMRRGEVLGLQWQDIDLEAELIHINRNVTYPTNQPTIGTPKTKTSIRDIPLSAELRSFFPKKKEEGYIFGGAEPWSRMVFNRKWAKIEKKIDFHGATPHTFRHTFLTILSDKTDVKTLQALAGHSDIQVTMNRYVHADCINMQKAIQNLDTICAENCAPYK